MIYLCKPVMSPLFPADTWPLASFPLDISCFRSFFIFLSLSPISFHIGVNLTQNAPVQVSDPPPARHHQSVETGSCRTPDTNARPTSPTVPCPICHFSTRHDLFFTNISHFWKSIRHASHPLHLLLLLSLCLTFTSLTRFCGKVAFCMRHKLNMICVGGECVCNIFSNMSHQAGINVNSWIKALLGLSSSWRRRTRLT